MSQQLPAFLVNVIQDGVETEDIQTVLVGSLKFERRPKKGGSPRNRSRRNRSRRNRSRRNRS